MAILFANNASSTLSVSIAAGTETIQVADSSQFPVPTGGNVFYVTLEDDLGDIEVVRCSGNDNVTTLTVDGPTGRGVDGTTAQGFTATVTRVELRLPKIALDNFLQLGGGDLTGNLDMNGNNVVDAVLSGTSTQMLAGEIVGVPLRGLTGTATNEIAVPTDGTTRATASGATILCQGDDIMAELDVGGVITFNSATNGIIIPGTFLRWADSDDSHRYQISHNGADITSSFTLGGGTQRVRYIHPCSFEGDTDYNGNDIVDANLQDLSVSKQTIASASGVESYDYSAGSYIDMTLTGNVTSLSFTNPPNSNVVGFVRLKITQGGTGSYTIDWTGFYFAQGNSVNPAPPVLSTAVGAIDYVDLWTDDGGTTWYGAWDKKFVSSP